MFSTMWLAVIFTLAGAAVGSFLNVCIGRIPEGLSIVSPSSRCPQCGHPIRFYDNIPVISFLLLGGKCRDCRRGISFRYPLIELLTAVFAWLLFRRFGLTPAFPAVFVFICTLIVISFIDLDHQIIPHVLTLTGIPVFAVLAVLFMGLTVIDAFLGIMIGAGILSGDFVIVDGDGQVGKGAIAAVRIGDEATVKRVYTERGQVRLKAENPAFQDILVNKNSPEFAIYGPVIGVMRKL